MPRRRTPLALLAACAMVAAVAVLGAPAAEAGVTAPPCPALDGWTGPTSASSSAATDFGGNVRCWYSPGPGSALPSTTEVLITASWVGDAENGPDGAMPSGGCGRPPTTSLASRQVNSAGTYASVTYGISGAGASGGEAILLSDQARLLHAVAVLLPAVESLAQSCTQQSDDPASDSTPVAPTDRIAGANRHDTATQISRFWDPATTAVVYVATGANFPDALGGGPAAAREGAPILLVEQGSIPATTAAELTRLQPLRIVMLGGTAAMSDGVAGALGAYAGTVDRVAGLNRYATAAAVSAYAFPGTSDVVYVASGRGFADPISAGAAAALDGAPLLLVDGLAPLEAVVANELVRLQPARIVVVGADGDLSGVLGSLAAFAPLERVNQADVYARSAALWDDVSGPVTEIVLATSNAFADALAGTPYAALDPVSQLMLSRSDCVPAVVRAQMERLAPDRVRLLGGTAALSASIETQATC